MKFITKEMLENLNGHDLDKDTQVLFLDTDGNSIYLISKPLADMNEDGTWAGGVIFEDHARIDVSDGYMRCKFIKHPEDFTKPPKDFPVVWVAPEVEYRVEYHSDKFFVGYNADGKRQFIKLVDHGDGTPVLCLVDADDKIIHKMIAFRYPENGKTKANTPDLVE